MTPVDSWGGRKIKRMTLDQARTALVEAATQVQLQTSLHAGARREVEMYRQTIKRLREGQS